MESDGSIIARGSTRNRNYFCQQSSTDFASKTDMLARDCKSQQAQWKTYLKVGQMTANPEHVVPFIIEWVPNLLPRIGIGELTIKFEFGHQVNDEIGSLHNSSS